MNRQITITLNGSPHILESPVSLSGLLESIGVAGKPVVVELNEAAVFPRDYEQTQIEDSARVELVILAAGG
jgi:sulfur carrier protein